MHHDHQDFIIQGLTFSQVVSNLVHMACDVVEFSLAGKQDVVLAEGRIAGRIQSLLADVLGDAVKALRVCIRADRCMLVWRDSGFHAACAEVRCAIVSSLSRLFLDDGGSGDFVGVGVGGCADGVHGGVLSSCCYVPCGRFTSAPAGGLDIKGYGETPSRTNTHADWLTLLPISSFSLPYFIQADDDGNARTGGLFSDGRFIRQMCGPAQRLKASTPLNLSMLSMRSVRVAGN